MKPPTKTVLMGAFKISHEKLPTGTLKQTKLSWSNATTVGPCVLELANLYMFLYHLKVVKRFLTANSDSSPLLYGTQQLDVYKKRLGKEELKKKVSF